MQKMTPFARHVYNIKRQFNELKYLKENLSDGEIIIQEDFAENLQIKYQQEIMAAHWSNDSVTLFPAVVYYKDKGSVYSFNKAILEDVKQSIKVHKVNY